MPPKTNEETIQKYTMKFWKMYDTKSTPRVVRGMERISKDVVDTFQMMLTEALEAKDKEREEAETKAWADGYADGIGVCGLTPDRACTCGKTTAMCRVHDAPPDTH